MDQEANRGRPRSSEADRAILRAALNLLMELGYAGMSVEGVAAEAGVGKTTIYRRYAAKQELAMAALASVMELEEVPDTGSARGDLEALVGDMMPSFMRGPGASLVGTLLAERERNPELLDTWRRRAVTPRMEQLRAIIARAQERGEIRPGIHLHTAGGALFGTLLAMVIIGDEVDQRAVERTVDQVLRGIAAG